MELIKLLQDVELFAGLNRAELAQVANICSEKVYALGSVIARQDEMSDDFYIIQSGLVEVQLEGQEGLTVRAVVQLGEGQILGEMALIDHGPRSATLRAISDPTIVQTINRNDFDNLCSTNQNIGYLVMRNLAIDLSFKLRHRNIRERGWHERV